MRPPGFEPGSSAFSVKYGLDFQRKGSWKADILPLDYSRIAVIWKGRLKKNESVRQKGNTDKKIFDLFSISFQHITNALESLT